MKDGQEDKLLLIKSQIQDCRGRHILETTQIPR